MTEGRCDVVSPLPVVSFPRVEDDDTSSSFPFNSCGTAAYVAPEALICNKKVNSSVDVSGGGSGRALRDV